MSQLDEFWAPVFEGKDLAGCRIVKWWKVTVSAEHMKSPIFRFHRDEELARLDAGLHKLSVDWVYVMVKTDGEMYGLMIGLEGRFEHCTLVNEAAAREDLRQAALDKLTPADRKILGIE
ncbi:MAG: hypothetical protein WCW31_02630 [Patescibacteria group bacterium]